MGKTSGSIENVLFSYHYLKKFDIKKIKTETFPTARLFLDSGAWSAFTQGVAIDKDKFTEYLHENKDYFHIYANLDDMLSARRSYENLKNLELNGLKPLPVFHTGEDLEWIKRYADNYPYICIGRIIPFSTKPKIIIPWMRKVMDICRHNKVHAFGVTNYNLVKMFPFHSFDSSSWGSPFRFGVLKLYDYLRKDLVSCRIQDSNDLLKNYDNIMYNGGDKFKIDLTKHCREKFSTGPISVISYCHYQMMLQQNDVRGSLYFAVVPGNIPYVKSAFQYLRDRQYAN